MSDFRNNNGIRVKTFEANDEKLINSFLLEYDGHIVNIQNAKGKVVVVYEDVNKYFIIHLVGEDGVHMTVPAVASSLQGAIDTWCKFYNKEKLGLMIFPLEVTREEYLSAYKEFNHVFKDVTGYEYAG